MAFPTQAEVEVPLLKVLIDLGGEAPPRDVYPLVAKQFPQLTQQDLEARMIGGAVQWWNHVQWTRQRLVVNGQIDGGVRGIWRVTQAGRDRVSGVGAAAPARATRPRRNTATLPTPAPPGDTQSPAATIEEAHQKIEVALGSELLQLLTKCSPAFFEHLVIDLLVTMGYGGSRQDAGQRLGRSGDGGIDGIIKEDRLGLGVIYIQAKRWDPSATVGSPELQAFAGALQGQRAHKGVFITTATFSRPAQVFAETLPSKIVLIDGPKLTRLMIDHGVGVTTAATFEIKRVDSDYFDET